MPKPAALDLDILPEVTAASKALAPAVKRLTKALKNLDPKKLPVGAAADALYDLRQLTRTLSTLAAPFEDALGPAIKLVEEHFIQTLMAGEASGVQGRRSRVQITTAVIPTVEDWSKFYAYIARTKSFELLNRAVNRAAVQERWELKKQVPGVGTFHAKKVSCTKLGGK